MGKSKGKIKGKIKEKIKIPSQECVYGLLCRKNGRVYVGTTSRLFIRISYHVQKLKAGSHRCKELQADWDRFGEEEFVWVIYHEEHSLELEWEVMETLGDLVYNTVRPGECVVCGGPLAVNKRKVCSSECARKWDLERKGRYCVRCRKPINSGFTGYACSEECRKVLVNNIVERSRQRRSEDNPGFVVAETVDLVGVWFSTCPRDTMVWREYWLRNENCKRAFGVEAWEALAGQDISWRVEFLGDEDPKSRLEEIVGDKVLITKPRIKEVRK